MAAGNGFGVQILELVAGFRSEICDLVGRGEAGPRVGLLPTNFPGFDIQKGGWQNRREIGPRVLPPLEIINARTVETSGEDRPGRL